MKKISIFLALISLSQFGFSQLIAETFNSTRIINGHSVETLKKRYLEYRIEHRFGDIASNDGSKTKIVDGIGFDAASDIRFGFEYGISDSLGPNEINPISFSRPVKGRSNWASSDLRACCPWGST